MSVTVPLGMALFHASNSQFLHLASRQKQFARMSSLKDHEPIDEKKAQEVVNSRWKRIMNGVERADNIERTLIFIGIGMAVQVSKLCTGHATVVNPRTSSPSFSSSFSLQKSSTTATVSSTIPYKVLAGKCAQTAARAGSGGCRLYGSYSGPGFTPHGSSSSRAAFAMFTAGVSKPSSVALLGMLRLPWVYLHR